MPAPNVVVAHRQVVENGAGTYKASVRVPANAILRFVRAYNRVAFTAATSAALVVGTTDGGNELLTSQNLKTGIAIYEVADADLDTIQPTTTAARVVYFTVTTVGAGTAGRLNIEVGFERLPDATLSTVNPIAAVKS